MIRAAATGGLVGARGSSSIATGALGRSIVQARYGSAPSPPSIHLRMSYRKSGSRPGISPRARLSGICAKREGQVMQTIFKAGRKAGIALLVRSEEHTSELQ